MRPHGPDALATVRHAFVVERLAAEFRVDRKRLVAERDMGALLDDIIYRLSIDFARQKQRGALVVRWPATWWQHLKQAAYRRFPWFLRPAIGAWPVRFHVERHLASRYLPAVDLPEKLLGGEFCVWTAEAVAPWPATVGPAFVGDPGAPVVRKSGEG